jgi:3-hydroxy-5-methyl-1-naphthoate 3-O-methyltransferase
MNASTAAPIAAEPLLQMLIGFEGSQVLITAHQLGVFKTLADCPAPFEEVCERLGVPRHSGERLLASCVALRLLAYDGAALRNTPATEAYLVPGSAHDLSGLVDYYANVYRDYSRLPEAVKQDAPQVGGGQDVFTAMRGQEEFMRRFSGAMHSLGLLEGGRLADAFPFEEVRHLLDMGGGSGALAIRLARQFPQLHVSIVDQPPVCALARHYIEADNLSDRVWAQPGDFWTASLPACDAILFSMVLHDWNETEGTTLLKRAHQALEPGGRVLIYEQLLEENRCGPVVATLTNLTMLLRTRTGSEYAESDYRRMLENAGFTDIRRHPTAGLRQLLSASRL